MTRFLSAKRHPNQQQLFGLLLALALLLAQSLGLLHRSEHAGSRPSSGTQTHTHTYTHSHGDAQGHKHKYEHSHEHEHEQLHDHEQHASSALFAHEQGSVCSLFEALAAGDANCFTAPTVGLPASAAQRPNSQFTSVITQRLAGAKPARGPPSVL